MSIRKDNYVRADVDGVGLVYGKVVKVRKNGITITVGVTSDTIEVGPQSLAKIPASEFKAHFDQPPAATPVVKPADKTPTETTVSKPKTPKAPRAGSKTAAALDIFNAHFGTKTRTEIVGLFMSEVGLSKGGASTYFANFKNKRGTTA